MNMTVLLLLLAGFILIFLVARCATTATTPRVTISGPEQITNGQSDTLTVRVDFSGEIDLTKATRLQVSTYEQERFEFRGGILKRRL